jgi:hypothetical protein
MSDCTSLVLGSKGETLPPCSDEPEQSPMFTKGDSTSAAVAAETTSSETATSKNNFRTLNDPHFFARLEAATGL